MRRHKRTVIVQMRYVAAFAASDRRLAFQLKMVISVQSVSISGFNAFEFVHKQFLASVPVVEK